MTNLDIPLFGELRLSVASILRNIFPHSVSSSESRLKKVAFKDVKAEKNLLFIGDDKFNYANVAFATINHDPKPSGGIGGSIEVVAREYSGPDGLKIIPHKYLVTSLIDNRTLEKFVEELTKHHEIDVNVTTIDNKLFSKEFLRTPHI